MLLQEFPDLQWLRHQSERRFESQRAWGGKALDTPGWPNVILNVRAGATHRDNIRGPLSIFTNLSGESHVETATRRVTIREGFFYLTNPDQHYTLDIGAATRTETFNIHFGEYFADQVLQSFQRPDILLENQATRPEHKIEFHNRVLFRSAQMNACISFIYSEKPSGILLEEKLAELVAILLEDELQLMHSRQQLPVIKSATRSELIRRLLTACDYAHTYFDRDLSLDELAAASCLSKFHFLRLFKIAFRKTPHQFIIDIRIRRSKELLRHTVLDIKTISRLTGFDSPSSFSRAFAQHTGVYPSQFRN